MYFRDGYMAQQWTMVAQEYAASGLSNREFCRQRGIGEKSFYYWQRKLRTQVAGIISLSEIGFSGFGCGSTFPNAPKIDPVATAKTKLPDNITAGAGITLPGWGGLFGGNIFAHS
jgi:hypothetical protein